VADARFEGAGCAISTASASLMTEAVKGKTVEEAEALFRRFHGLVSGKEAGAPSRPNARGSEVAMSRAAGQHPRDHEPGASTAAADVEEEDLGKLEVLAGVRDYPVRIKCATLAWHALRAALHGGDRVTTE
jgi:nitrogen fixation NifU-like protein